MLPDPYTEPEAADRNDKDHRRTASTERYSIQSNNDDSIGQDVGRHTEAKGLSASDFLPGAYEEPNRSNNECSVNNHERP